MESVEIINAIEDDSVFITVQDVIPVPEMIPNLISSCHAQERSYRMIVNNSSIM